MTQIASQDNKNSNIENPDWLKALPLTERLANLPTVMGEPGGKALRRLQKWQEQGPFNKEGYFERRLESDNLTEAELLFLLGEAPANLQTRIPQPPAWLADFLSAFNKTGTETGDLPLALQPFAPLLNSGLEKLQATLSQLARQYSELPLDLTTISRLFLPDLFQKFTSRLNRVLALEVNVARLEGRLSGDTPQARFASFLTGLQEDGALLKLLAEYPALARQLTLITNNWAASTGEFLTRLAADWPAILEKFAPENPGKLHAFKTGSGDSHRGGRSVFRADFESGFKIVYKPKSLGNELHFQELLEWLNERGATPAFRSLKIIDRGTHGWEEFVVAETCASAEEIRRFYRRQGAFLALLYALDATDLHQENLIAAGEHPVMVDLEALFHPRMSTLKPDLNWLPAIQHLEGSVMRVGLLPDRVFVGKGQGMDITGLGSKPGQLSPKPAPSWQGIGTDEVRMVREHFEMAGFENLPSLKGQPVNILNYTGEISEGFESLYRLLLRHRADFVAGPLEAFRQDEMRVILRSTTTYIKLLQESFHPDLLRDALDRDRFFEHLWATTEVEPYLDRVIPSEKADLHAEDIPVFTARPDSRDLFDSRGNAIPNFLAEAPYPVVRRHIEHLGETDLAWQLWFIKASLASVDGPDKFKPGLQLPDSAANFEPVPAGDFLKEALRLGAKLAGQALVKDAKVNWVGLSLMNESAWSVQASGLDLYSGVPGITLFLAYLGHLSGDSASTALARQALDTLRYEVGQLKKVELGMGAFEGWSGLIYLYTQLGALWHEPDLFREAAEFAAHLPALVEKDEVFDIIAGSAGTILALLALYEVYPKPELLTTAIQAGNHLLARGVAKPGGVAWSSAHNKDIFLTGFSHGTAGIAYSLLKLAEASGEARFKEIALAAIGYERSLFSEEHQNWPDLRENGNPDYLVMWCHGAAGIALGRLAALPLVDDRATRQEIEAGLATTIKQGFGFNHSLCHGDLGNLEPLLQAIQLLPGENYEVAFNSISRAILDDIQQEGPKSGIPLGVESPGLMSGLAGIGYGLLRLAAPDKVPPVLLLAGPTLQ
jgi:type 2 lantibiotic biosynthesis protein LanM